MKRLLFLCTVFLITGSVINVQAAGWVNQDVPDPLPAPNQPGGVTWNDPPANTACTMQGSGNDIWNPSDEFHFVYWDEPTADEFSIGCHVISLGGTPSAWGKAGLMARVAPLATNAPPFTGPESYAFCASTTNNGAVLQWRDGEGVNAAWDGGAVNQWMVGPNDVYLKLIRENTFGGATFKGYASLDKQVWVSLASHTFANILEDTEVYLGLALTAHDRNALATAEFDEINLDDTPISDVAPTDLACTLLDETTVELSWNNPVPYNGLKVFRAAAGGTPEHVQDLDGTATSTTDAPGDGYWTYYLVGDDHGAPTVAVSCEIRIGSAGIITADGFIASWLMLGPLSRTGPCVLPPADKLPDFLTDGGGITEENVLPSEGEEIEIDFAVAASTAVQGPMTNGQNPDAIDGVAVWYAYDAPGDLVDHNTFYGGNPDDHMVYHVCYIINTTGQPLVMIGGVSDDDTILVKMDNTVFFNGGGCHGYGGAGNIQYRFPFVLPPGEHRLMVKVFDRGGGSGFRIRFEDPETGLPITDKFAISIEPTMTSVPAGPTATVVRSMKTLIVGSKTTVELAVTGGPVTVTEIVPSNMTIGAISHGGTQDGNSITWTGVSNVTLTYEVTPSDTGGIFVGYGQESPPNGPYLPISGVSTPVYAEQLEGWLTADIADSGLLDQTSTDITTNPGPPETFDMTIVASGHDIWDAADDFRFVWREFPAEQSTVIQGRLLQFNRANNDWAKAGLMFRTFATQESPDVYLIIRPQSGNIGDHDVAWQWRDASGAGAAWNGWGDTIQNVTLPYWLRVVYQSGMVTGYYAPDFGGEPDPADWVQVRNPHPLNLEGSPTYLAGVAVTSHSDGAIVTAIFDSVRIVDLCEPVKVTRSIDTTGLQTVDYEGSQAPIYPDGTELTVTLTLSDVRSADSSCGAPGDVTITEYVPQGFTATNISGGGQLNGNTIVWSIPAAELSEGTLTYVVSGTIAGDAAVFDGEVDETAGSEFGPFAIGGDRALLTINCLSSEIGSEGVIKGWLLLGPLGHNSPSGNHDVSIMALDHLTDGVVTEEDIQPKAGDEITPDYNGAAASTGLRASANPALNPNAADGTAQWYAWRDADGRIDLDTNLLYGANDLAMAYGVCYLDVEEPMFVIFMIGSDDAYELKLDGEQIAISPVSRPWGGFQDPTTEVMLTEGVHTLLFKIFNGVGGWNFGVQITDNVGAPVTEGLCVSLNPQGCVSGPGPNLINVYTGDANGDNALNIADAVTVLQFLFAGGQEPACKKTADANADSGVNIADAVTILSYLFANKPMKAPDGTEIAPGAHPGCVGYDPETVSDIGCATPCTAQ